MGPPRKRASCQTSNGGPTTQKKQKTDNSSLTPSPSAPSEEWMEQKSLCSHPCKPEINGGEECGEKEVGGDSLANQTPVQNLESTIIEHNTRIKDEQQESAISQTTNQGLLGNYFCASDTAKLKDEPDDQKWIFEGKGEDQSFISETEDKKIKSYTCFCGKSYTCTSHLNRHRKIHLSEDQSSSGHHNIAVVKAKTTKDRSFICHCGRQYSSNSNLKRHQINCKEHETAEPTESAVTYSNVEDQDEKIKPYVCDCGRSYTSSSHLYRHKRSHHESAGQADKRYICECGKAYSCSSHLYRHQKTHTEEKVLQGEHTVVEEPPSLEERIKPYVCFCGKSYTCSSHLYRHQKIHHVDQMSLRETPGAVDSGIEKRYKCECGRSYTSSSHLYRHKKTHTESDLTVQDNDFDHDSEVDLEECSQKPYRCECGKSFILSFSLLLHKKIHCQWKHTTDVSSPPGD